MLEGRTTQQEGFFLILVKITTQTIERTNERTNERRSERMRPGQYPKRSRCRRRPRPSFRRLPSPPLPFPPSAGAARPRTDGRTDELRYDNRFVGADSSRGRVPIPSRPLFGQGFFLNHWPLSVRMFLHKNGLLVRTGKRFSSRNSGPLF